MLKLLFWLCMIILSLITGFYLLGDGKMVRLSGNGEMSKLENPYFSNLWTGEKNLALQNSIIKIPTSLIEKEKGIEVLKDLENEVKEIRIIYDEEKHLNGHILNWDNQAYECHKQQNQFDKELEKLNRQIKNMMKKIEKNKTQNKNLKIEYVKEKKTIEEQKNVLKEKHNAQKIEQEDLRKELASLNTKKETFDEKIKKLDEENLNLDEEKDKTIEEYEMKKIEIDRELDNKSKEELIHSDTIEGLQQEKKSLTKIRMKKETKILVLVKNNLEFLKNVSEIKNDANKKRTLRFQIAKFNSQKKSYEKDIYLKKDTNVVEMLEHHMEFLKTF